MPRPADEFAPRQARGQERAVLVTGGGGFVGSHLVDVLLARGDHVTIVDDFSTGRRANLPGSHPRLTVLERELRAALDADLPGRSFDAIYHLAAAVGVRLVMDEPIHAIETNVQGTSALLRFAVAAGPGGTPAPTLITSSSEVYGKPNTGVFSEDDDVHYGPTTITRWSYACGKAIDEYLALGYHRSKGLPVVVARLFNTVGPRQVGHYGMVLPRFVAAALNGEPLLVHGDGTQSRCFCDVRDVVGVFPRLLDEPACAGRVFNVGSDRAITIGALADLVLGVTGSTSPKRFIPYTDAFPPGFEDIRHRRPDLSRVRAAVGFEPGYSLEQTVKDLARTISEGER